MPRLFSSVILALACLVPGGPGLESAPAADPKKTTSARSGGDHVLVLRNGRIITGRVQLLENGYQVERAGGRVVVPRKLVEIEARNLDEAYRKMRAAMPERTAARHVVLARWCLSYGLQAQAARELRDALRLAPMHLTARTMITRLDPTIRPRGLTPTTRTAVAVLTRDAIPVESLGGLARSAAVEFVRRVQPLLVNRCGNGSCHAVNTSREFRLEPIGRERSGFSLRTRRNLDAVLGQLDLASPGRSRLLLHARREHGSGGRPARMVRISAKQVAIVEKWVADVIDERTPTSKQGPRGEVAGTKSPKDKTGKTVRSSGVSFRPSAVDVFDPKVFNRETRRRKAALKRSR